MKKISAKEAEKIMRRLGFDYGFDGATFYAVDEEETSVYAFDSKKDRDVFVDRNRR